jgi:drug/metabolite transporter (DMT)-like permease
VFIYSLETLMAIEPASTTVSAPAAINASSPAHLNRLHVAGAFFCIWVLWGSTYLAIRYAVATIPPFFAAGVRHLTAGVVLLIWCLWKGKRPTWAQSRAGIVIGALFFLIGHGTLHWAEQKVPSGLAALLIASEPIFVYLLSCAAERRWRMNITLLTGVVLGLGGVGFLMEKSALASSPGMVTSSIAILIGAFAWAVGIVYSRRSHLSGHPMLLSALSLISGALMLLVAGVIFGNWNQLSVARISLLSYGALAYSITFGSILTFSAYIWLLEHYSPTLVATHTYINPIVAVLLGWLLAGEAVTLNVGIAAAMVIGAVMLVDRGTARLHKEEKTPVTKEIEPVAPAT